MDCEPRRSIERSESELYSIHWSLEEGDEERRVLMHQGQLRAYFRFTPRREKGYPPHIPCGYPQFRNAYAHEATTLSRFATFEQDERGKAHIVSNGACLPMPKSWDRTPIFEAEGGRILNGVEAETLESRLWGVADRVKRQRQNAQRGYSTHRDRRGDYDHGNWRSLTERIVDSPSESGHSKYQYRRKKRPRTVIDEDQLSSHDVPVEYEPIGTAGPSHPPVVNKEEHLYGDEDGTYDEEVGEEEIPAGHEIVAENPVEDNPVEGQVKPAENKGKAVDRAWASLLAMW